MSPLTTIIATTAIWVFSYPVGVWILGDGRDRENHAGGRHEQRRPRRYANKLDAIAQHQGAL
jgi:hypothetical protein